MWRILILTRHVDERVIATTDQGRITITIIDIRGDRVRLGIDAPIDIVLHREEIQLIVDRERAAGLSLPHKGRRSPASLPADHLHRFAEHAIGPGEPCRSCGRSICGWTLAGPGPADLCMLSAGHIGECRNPYEDGGPLGLRGGAPSTSTSAPLAPDADSAKQEARGEAFGGETSRPSG